MTSLLNKMNPVYIASAIIGTGVVGFLVVSWVLGHLELTSQTENLLIVLRHGFEGALVGGICDFIAVKSVYTAARDHFPSLRDNTTRIVVQDMIEVRKQVEQLAELETLLQTPEYHQRLITAVEQFAPSETIVRQTIHDFWSDQIRPQLKQWILDYRFQGTAKQFTTRHQINTDIFRQGASELLKDVANQQEDNALLMERLQQLASDITLHDIGVPSEPEAVRHLLETLYTHWTSLDPKADMSEKPWWAKAGHGVAMTSILGFSKPIADKVKTTTLQDALSPLMTEETLKSTLLALADKIDNPQSAETLANNHDLLADVISYWLVFVRAWENMDPKLRADIVEELLRIIEEPALDVFMQKVWSLRMQLINPTTILEQQSTRNILNTLGTALKEQAESIEQTSITLLQTQFDNMGQDGFVDMLQRNTKARLDWIKVNGSAWGFTIGAMVGVVGLLLMH